MFNTHRSKIYLLFAFFLIAIPQWARADIVYPARLEIKELEAGVFNVTFTLPIVNNMRLKARPVLPPVCEDLTPHDIRGTAATYTETWQTSCDPQQLSGQPIQVEGLIGTQIDVILFLEMLDGRSFTATLKPSKAIFVVPAHPSLFALIGKTLVSGMQQILRSAEILLLIFLLVFFVPGHRTLPAVLIAFLIAHAAGQILAQQQWLLVSPYLAPLFAAFIAVLPTLKLARGKDDAFSPWQPFRLLAVFLGLLYGGANPEILSPEGLSGAEQRLAFSGYNVGVAAGLILGYLLLRELRQVLKHLPRFSQSERKRKLLSYVGGILAMGLFLYQLSVFIFSPSILPGVPPEFFMIAIVLAIWMGISASIQKRGKVSFLLILLTAGISVGLSGVVLPLESFVVLTTLFFFSAMLIFKREFPLKIILLIAGLTVLYHAGSAANFIQENLSKPAANAVGAAVLAVFGGFLSFRMARQSYKSLPAGIRMIGIAAAAAAVLFRSQEYLQWFDTTVATDYALGMLRLPLLFLALLIAALIVWPRKRKIHQHLGLKIRKPVSHLILLMLAFFMLPLGTVKVKNLFFTPDAPRDEQARRILQKVLSNTYEAFNLKDEDRLYDKLSQNVSGDLVADLYLDSRRRLTAGVRQGAEVTVKDVSVVSVGDTVRGINAAEGFSYQCKWVVTARVKHLQHVHHRQNIYTGVLTIKVNDEKWKIDRVALLSEDRIIIPWRAG
jgi:hydrogenase/urease accessory protein HupE